MKFLTLLTIFALYSSEEVAINEFQGSFDMNVVVKYKNGHERTDKLSYAFMKKKVAMTIFPSGRDPEVRMIFDPVAKTITSVFEMNGRKSGYILPMDEEHWPGMSYAIGEAGDTPSEKLHYTGQTKTIEEYKCREVETENKAYKIRMWVTDEWDMDMSKVLSYQSVGKGESREEVEMFSKLGVDGMPLALFLESKTGKADVQITFSNISMEADPDFFSTEGYELMKVEER